MSAATGTSVFAFVLEPEKLLEVDVGAGASRKRGLDLDIGGAYSVHRDFDQCDASGCSALLNLDEELLKRLKEGKTASVTIYQDNSSESSVRAAISLKGFTAGYDALLSSSGAPSTGTRTLEIPQTYVADLDLGIVANKGGDLWLEAPRQNTLILKPQGGAALRRTVETAHDLAACKKGQFLEAPIPLKDLPVGSFVCMRTNEGRVASLRIGKLSGDWPKKLTIDYVISQ